MQYATKFIVANGKKEGEGEGQCSVKPDGTVNIYTMAYMLNIPK